MIEGKNKHGTMEFVEENVRCWTKTVRKMQHGNESMNVDCEDLTDMPPETLYVESARAVKSTESRICQNFHMRACVSNYLSVFWNPEMESAETAGILHKSNLGWNFTCGH